jgi:hypothetical protein
MPAKPSRVNGDRPPRRATRAARPAGLRPGTIIEPSALAGARTIQASRGACKEHGHVSG